MKKASLYLFLVVSAANVLGNFIEGDLITNISKPLLMPALAFFFIANWTGNKHIIFGVTLLALFFSWAGDVLLMFQAQNPTFFLFGLGAFLLAHISYMVNYYHLTTDMGIKPNKSFIFFRIFILSIIGSALLNILWPKLGGFEIPVVLYTVVIILMAIFAVLRKDRTSPASFSYIYGGALLFIISDGMIAITKFIQPFDHYRMYIMLTYLIAQFLIVKGVLAHQKIV